MNMPGTLWLIPVPLGPCAPQDCLPAATLGALRSIDYVIAESARSARAFLKSAGHPMPLQAIEIREIGPQPDVAVLLEPIRAGRHGALVSEAGAPCVADPGAVVVAAAHALGIPVRPAVGPSALLLALMASGLEGQRYSFHGYLPVDLAELERALTALEAESARRDATQIWIEAPYRNDRMLAAGLRCLQGDTRLCVATDLTLPGESVRTATVARWRSAPGAGFDRQPSVFLLQASSASANRSRGPRRETNRATHRSASPAVRGNSNAR